MSEEEIIEEIKYSKCKFEKEFYQHYFEEIALETKTSLFKFFLPRNKNKNCKRSYKSINKKYIKLIKLNKHYITLLIDYIQNKLIEDEMKIIKTKIKNKVCKFNKFILEELFFENPQNHIVHQRFDKYIKVNIEKNNQFKLPWNVIQIKNAIINVLNYLDD